MPCPNAHASKGDSSNNTESYTRLRVGIDISMAMSIIYNVTDSNFYKVLFI